MNRTSNKVNIFGAILCFLFLLIVACKDPVEACLDIEATNYDVSADDPCPDCCTYPRLSLEVAHQYDSLRFSFDSIYEFAGHDARFEQVIFYLSDFKLLSLTDSLETVDTIHLDIIGAGAEIFKDDYTLVSRSIASFEYDVGEIRGAGNFATLRFSVGLAGNAEISNAEAITEEEHPLALTTDTLWTFPEGYVFNRVIINPDTLVNPEVLRQIDVKGPSRLVTISLPFQQSLNLGFDLVIPLEIDYKKWFSGIDFVGDTDDEIVEKIVENTTNAFSINE